VKKWHPDRFAAGSKQQTEANFHIRKINVAYSLIWNAPLRCHYAAGAAVAETAGPSTVQATYNDNRFFSFFDRFIGQPIFSGVIPQNWKKLIWWNFAAAVWMFVALNIYEAIIFSASFILMAVLWSVFWFDCILNRRYYDKFAALMLSIILLFKGFSFSLEVFEPYGTSALMPGLILYTWITFSHFAFVIFWRNRYYRDLGWKYYNYGDRD
jgi:hypothetical protein